MNATSISLKGDKGSATLTPTMGDSVKNGGVNVALVIATKDGPLNASRTFAPKCSTLDEVATNLKAAIGGRQQQHASVLRLLGFVGAEPVKAKKAKDSAPAIPSGWTPAK